MNKKDVQEYFKEIGAKGGASRSDKKSASSSNNLAYARAMRAFYRKHPELRFARSGAEYNYATQPVEYEPEVGDVQKAEDDQRRPE